MGRAEALFLDENLGRRIEARGGLADFVGAVADHQHDIRAAGRLRRRRDMGKHRQAGDLVQHLPEAVGNDVHKRVPGEFAVHPVEVKDGSRLAAIVGEGSDVTSHHHQGLGRLGEGLVETAWAEDGTLEAVEDPSLRFAVGVQWHPEVGEDAALFEALVEQARAFRASRTV